MLIFRPGQKLLIPGATVLSPRSAVSSANWWDVPGQTCIAAYQPKGSASLAASYTNLTGNATNNAAPGVAPTWDATGGWTFDGTTQYLTTGVVPGSSWTMIVRFSDATNTSQRVMIGQQKSGDTDRYYLSAYLGLDGIVYGSGLNLRVAPSITSGIIAVAANKGYRNGSQEPGTISGWLDAANYALYIGAHNLDNSPTFHFAGKIQAIAIYSTTLSGADVASLTTAMAAL